MAVEQKLTFIDAVRHLPNVVFLVTVDGALVDSNQAGMRLSGLTTLGTEAKLSALLMNSENELAAFLRVCARSPSPVRGELVWRTPEGPAALQLTAWRVTPGDQPDSARIVIQCDDEDDPQVRIRGLKRQLAKLRAENLENRRSVRELAAALQTRADFIARAAHEIRNPLNVFHLTLQLLYLKPQQSEEEIRALLDKLRGQLNRITSLVDHLLDLARFRAGNFNLEPEPFDLAELAKEVVQRFSSWHPQVTFNLRAEGKSIGTWDRRRIEKALANLVANAVKYGVGSPIRIGISRSGSEVLVSVQDDGIGIPDAERARIFQRFETPVVHSGVDGLGLGLLIARLSVEAHGGRIAVESGERGATFTVRLPLKTAGVRSVAAPP